MREDKTGEQSPNTGSQVPEVVEESKEISRRKFIRKSAEVAAISLFGVLGFDAVADKVLEQISERKTLGTLSDVATNALVKHRRSFRAEASEGSCVDMDHPVHCDTGLETFNCNGVFGCTDSSGTQRYFMCTLESQTFKCNNEFNCQIQNNSVDCGNINKAHTCAAPAVYHNHWPPTE